MPERRISVFFYGLFMDSQALRAKGLQPQADRTARVSGFALRIGPRATLVPDPGSCVYGIVMDLTHSEVEQLYAEPSVRVYRPEAVIAEPEGAPEVAALCFNLPAAPGVGERNPEYAARLRELAQRLRLPAQYIAGIG